jgi:hypothetical protein
MPMKVPRPSAADRARFQALVPPDERVEVKSMFGNLGAFAYASGLPAKKAKQGSQRA